MIWLDWLEIFFTVEIDNEPYQTDYHPEDDIVSELESGYQYIMF